MNKLSEIFPSLEEFVKEKKISYSGLSYIAKLIPALGFMESQEVVVKNLNVPFDDANSSVQIEQLRFWDSARLSSTKNNSQENKISLNNIKINHSVATLAAQSFDFSIILPQVQKAKNPLMQLMNTPQLQQKMSLRGATLTAGLSGSDSASFDLIQDMFIKQDPKTYNADITLRFDVSNLRFSNPKQTTKDISVQVNMTGFTMDKAIVYSAALSKRNEILSNTQAGNNQTALQNIQKEVERAYTDLTKDMIVSVDEIAVRSADYSVVLKGKIIAKDVSFNGTLQVTNFDLLAPEAKKIDEKACEALVDKMLTGSINSTQFKNQYETTCNDGSGPLTFLRSYANTAKRVRDINGKEALSFDIRVNSEELFINNQKVGADVSSAAMGLVK